MRSLRPHGNGTWTIARRPGYRAAGWVLTVLTIAGAVIVVMVTQGEPDAWPLWIIPGAFGLFGLPMLLLTGVARIDPERRTIVQRGNERPATDFMSIALLTGTRTVQTEHGQANVREWSVGLVRREVSPQLVHDLEQIQAAIGNRTDISAEDRAEALALLERHRPLMERETDLVLVTHDEHDAWRVGEWLAKTFRLPVIDLAGGGVLERGVTELDEPIMSRLARRDPPPEDPGPPPAGLTVEDDDRRLVMRWNYAREGAFVGVVLGITFAVIGIVAFALGEMVGMILGITFGGMSPILVLVTLPAMRGTGPAQLELAGGQLRYTTHRPWRKVEELPLRELEHVRSQTEPAPFVSFMSDARMVRALMSSEHTEWMRRKLEHWLAAQGSARARS